VLVSRCSPIALWGASLKALPTYIPAAVALLLPSPALKLLRFCLPYPHAAAFVPCCFPFHLCAILTRVAFLPHAAVLYLLFPSSSCCCFPCNVLPGYWLARRASYSDEFTLLSLRLRNPLHLRRKTRGTGLSRVIISKKWSANATTPLPLFNCEEIVDYFANRPRHAAHRVII
jgi:hypothetical protein